MKSLRILALMMAAWLAAAGILFAQEPAPTPAEETPAAQKTPPAPAADESPATVAEQATQEASDAALKPEAPAAPEAPAVSSEKKDESAGEKAVEPEKEEEPKKQWVRRETMVGIGQDVHLRADERCDDVVVIFGDAVVDGKVDENVVVIGGRVKINGSVGENAVLVLSNGELGPDASVQEGAVVVAGHLQNPHEVRISGRTVMIDQVFPDLGSAPEWIRRGLVMGRPVVPSLRMTWFIAAGFLGLYLFISLILGRAVNATAATLETRPGSTLLASLLFLPALPVFIIILAATGIGVLLIPFVLVGTFFAAIFGKAAFLAFVGRLVLRPTANDKISVAVLTTLVGGIIVSLLYGVWYLGFALWALTTWIGIGMVLMTVIGAIRRERPKKEKPAPVSPATGVGPSAVATVPGASPGGVAAMSAPASSGLADAPAEARHGADAVAGTSGFADQGASASPPPAAAIPPVQPALPPTSPVGYERAGFGIRLAAIAVDIVLIAGFCALIHSSGAFAVFFGIYTTLLWCFRATSVGGIICGLKIVRLDGRPVDFATAVVRTLGGYLSLLCVGLGFLWVIWDSEMQTWHDKIAGTTVIRVPKGMSLV